MFTSSIHDIESRQRRKMERTVKIGSYDDSGLHLEWSQGFEISVLERKGEVTIKANEAGPGVVGSASSDIGGEGCADGCTYSSSVLTQ
jgi:hypothetical protein